MEASGTTPFLKGVKSSLTCIDGDPFLSCLVPKNGLAGTAGSSAGLRDGDGAKLWLRLGQYSFQNVGGG